ncbi:hypothetical protein M951_chr2142 (nucleomorph) [Lotharella oceanica]|uniref:Uncharacterized protein n=1 Tax=Lotharella oceanica TaxID=641309 RepID=A0A060DAW9_9EUKA|nr:hypothetical protein M951_chr2142 [Lotharella oceanica]
MFVSNRYIYLNFFSYQFIKYLLNYEYNYQIKKMLNINLSRREFGIIMILLKIVTI